MHARVGPGGAMVAEPENPNLPTETGDGAEAFRYLPDVPKGLLGASADAAAILSALARTSRSFSFYSPNNRAIRMFVDDLEAQLRKYLEAHGPLQLKVEATQFMMGSDVVHEDEDRERSLPFKLFRDGVRQITLFPGITSPEISSLLQILSVRLVGIHRFDEDLVTRLWRAELEHVRHQVVEGFTHDLSGSSEGGDGEGGGDSGAALPRIVAHLQAGTPMPRPPSSRVRDISPSSSSFSSSKAGPLFHVLEDDKGTTEIDSGSDSPITFAHAHYPGISHYDIPAPSGMIEIFPPDDGENDKEAIRAELDGEDKEDVVLLLESLLAMVVEYPDLLNGEDVARAIASARRNLVREERLEELVALLEWTVETAWSATYGDAAIPLREVAHPAFMTPAAVKDAATLAARMDSPASFDRYLDLIEQNLDNDSLVPILDYRLPTGIQLAVLRTLWGRTGGDVGWYRSQLTDEASDFRCRALYTGLLALGTDDAIAELARQAKHTLDTRRFAAVDHLARARLHPESIPALVDSLGDTSLAVRQRALEALAGNPGSVIFPHMERWMTQTGLSLLTREELPRLLTLLAQAGKDQAIPFLCSIVKVPSPWKLLNPQDLARSEAATLALARCGTEAAVAALRNFKDQGTSEWKQHVLKCMIAAHRLRESAEWGNA